MQSVDFFLFRYLVSDRCLMPVFVRSLRFFVNKLRRWLNTSDEPFDDLNINLSDPRSRTNKFIGLHDRTCLLSSVLHSKFYSWSDKYYVWFTLLHILHKGSMICRLNCNGRTDKVIRCIKRVLFFSLVWVLDNWNKLS